MHGSLQWLWLYDDHLQLDCLPGPERCVLYLEPLLRPHQGADPPLVAPPRLQGRCQVQVKRTTICFQIIDIDENSKLTSLIECPPDRYKKVISIAKELAMSSGFTCLVCMESITHFALGVCNHRNICAACSVKQRVFFKVGIQPSVSRSCGSKFLFFSLRHSPRTSTA